MTRSDISVKELLAKIEDAKDTMVCTTCGPSAGFFTNIEDAKKHVNTDEHGKKLLDEMRKKIKENFGDEYDIAEVDHRDTRYNVDSDIQYDEDDEIKEDKLDIKVKIGKKTYKESEVMDVIKWAATKY